MGADVLCLRNWRGLEIVSSRNVWLAIAVGMSSYLLGGTFFGCIEIILNEEPDVSIGDIFFVLTYISFGIGMISYVGSRGLNLEKWQLLIGSAIALFASVLAWWICREQTTPSGALVAMLSWFYVVNDVFVLIIAITLPLAFWGVEFPSHKE